MPALLLAAADAILSDVEAQLAATGQTYKKLDLHEKLGEFLRLAADRMAMKLGGSFGQLRPHITDFISFGASIYEPHHTLDVARRADTLGLLHAELHSVDLGGASTPAALELARRIVQDENRLVLLAASEVPRGGPGGIAYYREISDALLEKNTERHTQANLISLYALLADRLMFEHEIKQVDIDAITAFFRKQAIGNERASVFGKPLKPGELERYLAGPYATAMVAVATDHGAAFLVGNEKSLAELRLAGLNPSQPVLCIRGVGTHHAPKYLTERPNFESPAELAAERAFSRAHLKREDIDYAWVYDCFTLMLVRQAADYFHIKPHDAAKSLAEGFIEVSGRRVHINQQGGILNTQAAISLSAATGLLDILAFAEANPQCRHFLFGGNGGIDCTNSVALLSRDFADSAGDVVRAPDVNSIVPRAATAGETAALYAAVVVRFNPGSDVPFCLGCVRREDGTLFLARIYGHDLKPLTQLPEFSHDKTRVTLMIVDARPVAVLI
jgi:acetyl-CoA acyltransferase